MNIETIIILRHGETDWNAEGRFTSSTDLPLNERGHCQAKEAASSMNGLKIDRILSSPMIRTRQTANHVLASCNMSPAFLELDKRLSELDFGPFEDKTIEEIKSSELSTSFRAWRREENPVVPKGTEEYDLAFARVNALVTDLKDDGKRTVLLVTHGHIARILIGCCVLFMPPHLHRRLRLDNGRFAILKRDESIFRLVSLNTNDLSTTKTLPAQI